MSWLSPPQSHVLERLAAVGRRAERAVGDEDLVRVRRRDRELDVVAGAADQRALPVHDASSWRRRRPSARAIPGRRSGSARRRDSNSIGATATSILPSGDFGSPGASTLRPGRAAVVRHVDAAARAAAQHRPRVHLDLPRAGEQHVRDSSRPSTGRSSRCSRRRTDALSRSCRRRSSGRRRAPAAGR